MYKVFIDALFVCATVWKHSSRNRCFLKFILQHLCNSYLNDRNRFCKFLNLRPLNGNVSDDKILKFMIIFRGKPHWFKSLGFKVTICE